MASERAPLAEWTAIGDVEFNEADRLLREAGEVAELSPLAAALVARLVRDRGNVVSRGQLIETLWSGNHLVGEAALNRLVSELRRAAASLPGGNPVVHTAPRKGYWIAAAPARPDPAPQMKAGRFLWRWAVIAVVMILGAALLHWLIEDLIGLIWVLRHPG